jgi:quercetin dioxygenase-like cupin family protein
MSYYFPDSADCGRHTIFGSVSIATLAGEHLQLSVADLPAGSAVGEHTHPNEQMGIVLAGELKFTIGGETRTLRAGDLYRIPGGVPHAAAPVGGPARALDVFYPIRDEYR